MGCVLKGAMLYYGALFLMIVLVSTGQSHGLALEHSLDGSTYTTAGTLVGDVRDDVLILQRSAFSHADKEKLAALIARDGFYTVRVTGADRKPVSASVRASCLAHSSLTEQVRVAVDELGNVVGLSYNIQSPSCRSPAAVPPAATALVDLPLEANVAVDTAKPAPQLDSIGPSAGSLGNVPPQVFAEQDIADAELGPGEVRAGGAPRTRGKAPPKVDDRTWLQKNWLFIIGAAMMGFNLYMKATVPPPAPGGAAGAPTTAAAPAGRGGGGGGRR